METKFKATAIRRTRSAGGRADQTLEITLADATGSTTTVGLTPELARSLVRELTAFAEAAKEAPLEATKMPKKFAVGTGQFESVVLVRFENEAPYGLALDDAWELGKALLENVKTIDAQPARLLQ